MFAFFKEIEAIFLFCRQAFLWVCAGTSKQQQPQRNRRDPTEFRFRSHNARSIATRATKCAEIRHKEDIKQIISPTAQQVSFHALHMHTSIANQFARARRRGFFLLGESPCVVYVCTSSSVCVCHCSRLARRLLYHAWVVAMS